MELFEKVKNAIIKVQPGIDTAKIIPTANLGTDLEIDSLGRVELALAIEDSFGFYLPDEDLEKITTVNDIVALIETKLRSRGA